MDQTRYSRVLLWAFCLSVILFLLAPIIVIIIASFNDSQFLQFPPQTWSLRWYGRFFASPHWYEPAFLSLRIALVTMVISTALGTLAAIGLVRGEFRGKRITELFLISPLFVPVIVIAIGLYFQLARIQLIGKPIALYLAHALLATPVVILIVGAALKSSDASLELAARSLGANWIRTARFVVLPMIRPALISAAGFAFLISFDEVVLAIFLGGPNATTLPKRMWESMRFEIDPTLTAISSLLILVAVSVLVAVALLRRTLERARGKELSKAVH